MRSKSYDEIPYLSLSTVKKLKYLFFIIYPCSMSKSLIFKSFLSKPFFSGILWSFVTFNHVLIKWVLQQCLWLRWRWLCVITHSTRLCGRIFTNYMHYLIAVISKPNYIPFFYLGHDSKYPFSVLPFTW